MLLALFVVRARLFSWFSVVAIALVAIPLGGQPLRVEGHVVSLEGDDIVVDVARSNGAENGAVLELWRPVSLKHPISGETISDRFLIGKLRLHQTRDALSLARAEGRLARAVRPGDVVVLTLTHAPRSQPPAATPAPTPEPEAPASSPPATPPERTAGADKETAEVTRLFEALRGSDLTARVRAYEAQVRARPDGRYTRVLWEEAQLLRRLVELETPGGAKPTSVSFSAPGEVLERTPLELAIELEGASGALLHYARRGDVVYRTLPMQRSGEGYFSVSVPAEHVQAPRFEYFIEATNVGGVATPVQGEPDRPLGFDVVALPAPQARPNHEAVASISTDYADWNNLEGNDWVWQSEGFIGLRLRDVGVRAVNTGFGVYRGVGGSLEELDELGLPGRAVGLTYGYLEGEFGLSHFMGLVGRAVIGLENAGVSGGGQLLVRFGNDRETNLLVGGEVLGNIGLRGITQLELMTFERVPILLRTEVTNQPVGSSHFEETDDGNVTATEAGDVGARAIAQVGYRFLPALTVALRVSYQGRNIHHAGPGLGGGVTYRW
ncbi:MAG TPA: hypothetical protein VM686_07120 [Polyangiaceae bacterium]|nr:hypothetical protein [Polyangiaceae bacterium]